MSRRHLLVLVAIAAAGACATPSNQVRPDSGRTPEERAFRRSIYGPTWSLVEINARPVGPGSAGRPATLILYSGSDRTANGFAGCNRWSSTYELTGRDSIRFAAPVSTRMACDEGMQLESDFLGVIARTRRAAQRDSSLVLYTNRGDSARFVAR